MKDILETLLAQLIDLREYVNNIEAQGGNDEIAESANEIINDMMLTLQEALSDSE